MRTLPSWAGAHLLKSVRSLAAVPPGGSARLSDGARAQLVTFKNSLQRSGARKPRTEARHHRRRRRRREWRTEDHRRRRSRRPPACPRIATGLWRGAPPPRSLDPRQGGKAAVVRARRRAEGPNSCQSGQRGRGGRRAPLPARATSPRRPAEAAAPGPPPPSGDRRVHHLSRPRRACHGRTRCRGLRAHRSAQPPPPPPLPSCGGVRLMMQQPGMAGGAAGGMAMGGGSGMLGGR